MKRCYPLLPLSEPLPDRRTEAERAVDRVCGSYGAAGSPLTRLAALRLSLDSLDSLGDGVVVGPTDPLYAPLRPWEAEGESIHRPGGLSPQGGPVARGGTGTECAIEPSGWYLDADGERRWGRDWQAEAEEAAEQDDSAPLWNGAAWALVFEAGFVLAVLVGVWVWRLAR
jgi:hypothetical protein